MLDWIVAFTEFNTGELGSFIISTPDPVMGKYMLPDGVLLTWPSIPVIFAWTDVTNSSSKSLFRLPEIFFVSIIKLFSNSKVKVPPYVGKLAVGLFAVVLFLCRASVVPTENPVLTSALAGKSFSICIKRPRSYSKNNLKKSLILNLIKYFFQLFLRKSSSVL